MLQMVGCEQQSMCHVMIGKTCVQSDWLSIPQGTTIMFDAQQVAMPVQPADM